MVSGFLTSPCDHSRIFSGLAREMRIAENESGSLGFSKKLKMSRTGNTSDYGFVWLTFETRFERRSEPPRREPPRRQEFLDFNSWRVVLAPWRFSLPRPMVLSLVHSSSAALASR